MKKSLLFASLLLAVSSLGAQSFIIYSKGDYSPVDPTTPATKPVDHFRAAFLAAVQAELAHPIAFETGMTLIAPPDWGRTVPGAAGKIAFHESYRGGFFVHVVLDGLAKDRRYILTLNGNPKLAGNDRLVDAVPGLPAERYFDFLTITTDDHGHFEATFGIALLPGPYDVRFYVKDTVDFKIVLYHDYFRFTVE